MQKIISNKPTHFAKLLILNPPVGQAGRLSLRLWRLFLVGQAGRLSYDAPIPLFPIPLFPIPNA
ncbi:MAG: hypothetical protein F6J93_06475 [Oscillatoria sp. SIO1A7]|nr:hypothetical protein [Oscillatoria sp. SIO1A7]